MPNTAVSPGDMTSKDAFAQAFPQLFAKIDQACPDANWDGLWLVAMTSTLEASSLRAHLDLFHPDLP